MKNKNLIENLTNFGFWLVEPKQVQDANKILADLVKSDDLRLWEGFPVVLANSADRELFNYNTLKKYLKEPLDRMCFDSLLLMSLALYKSLNLEFFWADKFYKSMSRDKKNKFNNFLNKIKKEEEFKINHHSMSAQRLKSVFNNYFNQNQAKFRDLVVKKEGFSLEYALSQLFPPKQKELFLKKIKGEKFTKTEKEYFSRVVKKKTIALSNQELHRLAQKILE